MTSAPRHASCQCGQLRLDCTGEALRVSLCHCRDCKARSGSAFAVQVRFRDDQVTASGDARHWRRIADSGNAVDFHFCPQCGSTMWLVCSQEPGVMAVPIGNFAPGHGFTPGLSVFEQRMDRWIAIVGEGIEHRD